MTIAFVTYETSFAPCGGVAATMEHLPVAVANESGERVVVLSPYHHRIGRMRALDTDLIGRIRTRVDGTETEVNLHLHRNRVEWLFLQAQDSRFFAGLRHPFDVKSGGDLLRDSLLFGTAAAGALGELDAAQSWRVFMQDWEGATTALALAGRSGAHRLILTLHNTYDKDVSDEDLRRFAIDPAACPGRTVLSRALPHVEKQVVTVSQQFACDITRETWQCRIMAAHLQDLLQGRLLGIDNGPFVELNVGRKILEAAKEGRLSALKRWKTTKRARFLQAIRRHPLDTERPIWGDYKGFPEDRSPWFVMAGRDDPRQKGYDLAASAARRFLEEWGEAKFLFFPIPGDEGIHGLGFLRNLAERFPKNVLVFPFRFSDGFSAALQGASFGLMPSFYEPFGMANEYYLNGTAVIGRATGGLIQQVVPVPGVSSFTEAVASRYERAIARDWWGKDPLPTGILFRESDELATAETDWQAVNAAQYDPAGNQPDRVTQRERLPLFAAMSGHLRDAMRDGARIFESEPERYCAMIVKGIENIQMRFAWQTAARAYLRVGDNRPRTSPS